MGDFPKAPSGDLTYSSYLKIPELLSLQKPQSEPLEHDEMLFILIHQVYELWFRQMHHELDEMIRLSQENNHLAMIKVLRRIIKIQDLLNLQVSVIETMTPTEFEYFRNRLQTASGFQSYQFRKLEFRLGMKEKRYLQFYEKEEAERLELIKALQAKSLQDHLFVFFQRAGLKVPKELLEKNTEDAHELNEDWAKEIAKVYRKPHDYWQLYELFELLMDFDQRLGLWRYRHIQMVQRTIGITLGTGGSHGVDYLNTTLKKRAFPEIWQARQYIINHPETSKNGKKL